MKATTIQLTPESQAKFDAFHSEYRGYRLAKNSYEEAEQDMKASRKEWQQETPEYDAAPGETKINIISEDGEPVASFTKARAVNQLDVRAYIDSVLASEGVDETTRTTITGMLAATKLLDEITIGITLAKKQHPDELEDSNLVSNVGPRTVKFL